MVFRALRRRLFAGLTRVRSHSDLSRHLGLVRAQRRRVGLRTIAKQVILTRESHVLGPGDDANLADINGLLLEIQIARILPITHVADLVCDPVPLALPHLLVARRQLTPVLRRLVHLFIRRNLR